MHVRLLTTLVLLPQVIVLDTTITKCGSKERRIASIHISMSRCIFSNWVTNGVKNQAPIIGKKIGGEFFSFCNRSMHSLNCENL